MRQPVAPSTVATATLRRTLGAFGRVLAVVAAVALPLLGLTAATFAIGRLVPIDPVLAVVGDRASVEVYERTREAMGVDRPVVEQYLLYLRALSTGDLGVSTMTSRPVVDDIARVFPATFELATAAMLIGVFLGIPMGVAAASHRGRTVDHVFRVLGLAGYSVPIFWLGLVGLLLFYAKLGWVAGPGRFDPAFEGIVPAVTGLLLVDTLIAGDLEAFRDALAHLALPACVLGFVTLAYIARMTRGFMLQELSQDYVVTARAKGLSETRIIWGHAFRNVLVPLVTVLALSYGAMLEGAVLTETVFAWPGIGLYVTRGLFNSDMNAVLGGVLVIGIIYVVLNAAAEAAYGLLDPRTRR